MLLHVLVRGLDGRTVFEDSQKREDGALWEVGVLERAARLANNGTQLGHHGLKMSIDPRAASSLQGAEKLIALHINAFVFGHSDTAPKCT